MKIAVIGAGSWGSALAWSLASNAHEVVLWARSANLVSEFNATQKNERYLKDVVFPQNVMATGDLSLALTGAQIVVLATPSAALRQTAMAMQGMLGPDSDGCKTPVVVLSKGIENDTGSLLLDVLADVLGASERLAVLSGPNHAEEVARGMLSGTVVASANVEVAHLLQDAFATPSFRVYTSNDVVGVQLCGAAKNIIAVAAGIAHGLGLGDNTAAMLMTRGLAEISRLVEASGGQPQTCMGLAGMGDLIVTCTSPYSRNRGFGEYLAGGKTLEDYERDTHMVVEGARACLALPVLAKSKGVNMPISEHVRLIVWEKKPVAEMLENILDRPLRPEFY